MISIWWELQEKNFWIRLNLTSEQTAGFEESDLNK